MSQLKPQVGLSFYFADRVAFSGTNHYSQDIFQWSDISCWFNLRLIFLHSYQRFCGKQGNSLCLVRWRNNLTFWTEESLKWGAVSSCNRTACPGRSTTNPLQKCRALIDCVDLEARLNEVKYMRKCYACWLNMTGEGSNVFASQLLSVFIRWIDLPNCLLSSS